MVTACALRGVVGNLAEISLNPYLPKSLFPDEQLPKRKTCHLTIKITAVL
ncbi:MAG: indole-3-glycerol-phosphate synthase [Microcystis flos-aquae TF09]|uniref:Indole-3-glycerol-phosphate synthase n=1 Tax=Microcystis flos-aquae TF09 TaxID=2060473 RepID=A0A3E0LBL6_9CHRO|nr:MAG: indole-3-glycerol-phosphate synthase [Microcystis flos-aquae TF09]